ncbi:anthranilate synthase component I [Gryllotalpicola sp.]|uniref:anthranilate synthase component I n=1 Tax=Gryllotalpicola sp. TaxID=1932787 RepID=UPI002634C312|nr:anthranilate synthase component I [Gryllotalpicola sp.]
MTTTTRAAFDVLLQGHRVVPVVRDLFADGETPVGVFRKLAGTRPGTFLLESAEQGGIWSRYSFVGARSFGMLTQTAGTSTWLSYGLDESRALGSIMPDVKPLDVLDAFYQRWATPRIAGLPPLTGGLVGFIGWEAVRQLERLPHQPVADYDVPGQALGFVADLVVLDHKLGTVQLIANALNDGLEDADTLWADAQARIDALQHALAQPLDAQIDRADLDLAPEPHHRTAREDYLAAVERSQEYIRAGDVFQVVISQRFEQPVTAAPVDVYRVLRSLNPSPYMYLLQLERPDGTPYQIVGSSPEALVKVTDGRVITHPIAGSLPRGATPEADVQNETDLLASPKERAEHLMLVDLSRNDLAKVCVAGTVAVTEFMRVERFSHIMHLVSTVEGDLQDGADAVDVFKATFPAGTLSGAPKPRALEIIDELEPAQRGVYGGVVGYFDFAGDADLAIAIRTATLIGGTAYVQAGGGLVADSVPVNEFQESQNKAAAPLRAVTVANAMVRLS